MRRGMIADLELRSVTRRLVLPVLCFCASNFLAGLLHAQGCSNPAPAPTGTYTSGDHSATNNNALSADNLVLSGSATATFVAGNCIQLLPGFHATAGTAATTLHAWVETLPSASTIPANTGSGSTQQFTWTVSSPAGYSNLADVFVIFNSSPSGANGCYIHYNRASNLLSVADNSGANWSSGIQPGNSATTGSFNPSCTVNGVGSSAPPSGTQISLTVSVTFQPSFSGTWTEYLKVFDNEGLYMDWQPMGAWTVPAPPPDFTLGLAPLAPANSTIIAGATGAYTATYTVTVGAANGFSGSVNLGAVGLPPGAFATFSPPSITGAGSSTMTVNTALGGATGTYSIIATGTSGSLIHASIPASLVVQDFTVGLSPANSMIAFQSHLTFTARTSSVNGYSGNVNLLMSVSGPGPSMPISPNSVLIPVNTQTTFDAVSYDAASSQPYTVQLSGSVGNVQHFGYAYLITGTAGDFSLSAPAPQTVGSPGTATFTIPVNAQNGFNGGVSFLVSGLPSGAGATFSPASLPGGGLTTLTVNVPTGTAAQTYPLTITGTYYGTPNLVHSTAATLVVASGPDFGVSPLPVTMPPGTASLTVEVNRINDPSGSIVGTVNLSVVPDVPGTLTVSGQQSGITSGTTFTVTAPVEGDYLVWVTGCPDHPYAGGPGCHPVSFWLPVHRGGILPSITSIAPSGLLPSSNAQITVAGSNFLNAVLKVSPPGAATIKNQYATSNTIIATLVLPFNASGPLNIFASNSAGNSNQKAFTITGTLPSLGIPSQAQPLDSSSALEVNLGPVPLDIYDTTANCNSTDCATNVQSRYIPDCDSSISVRQCFLNALQSYAQQGVTGVRFMFGLCGGGRSTALKDCGTDIVTLSAAWGTHVQSLLQDIKNVGILKITPTPAFSGFEQDQALPADPSKAPDFDLSSDPCGYYSKANNTGITQSLHPQLQYWPALTYPIITFLQPDPEHPGQMVRTGWSHYAAGWNNAYNCAPRNEKNFVGWTNIYKVFDELIRAVPNGMVIEEVDYFNEMVLHLATVQARILVDPSPSCGPGQENQICPREDVFETLSQQFGAGKVTVSVETYSSTGDADLIAPRTTATQRESSHSRNSPQR